MRQPKLTHKKRKLRLSLHKLKDYQEYTIISSWNLHFYQIHLKILCVRKGRTIPLKGYTSLILISIPILFIQFV